MHRADFEDLLQKLAEIEEERAGPLPSDDSLRALAQGRLAGAEEIQVATAVATNPAARERLAALTGVTLPQPGPRVRERVLAELAGRQPALRPRRSRHWQWGLAAAAALAAALAWPLLRSPEPLRDSYTAAIEGIVENRGTTGETSRTEPTEARAKPDTLLTLHVKRQELTDRKARFHLYRLAGGTLERVAAEFVASDENPRHAVLKASARDLVGTAVADYPLFVVVAQAGDAPPERVTIPPGVSPQAALGDGQTRKVLPLHVELKPSETSPRGDRP